MTVMSPSLAGASQRRGAQLGYRPALDGLRAIAVVAVLLYHGGVSWMRGGFLGVDVFFVLSGFLITSLLIQEWTQTGRIALVAFWLRRARRLLPAMFIVVLAVVLYTVVLDGAQPMLRGDALATLGYVSNWWFIASGQSYFGAFIEPSALRHTWSLAIEEQFYIGFPLLLMLLLGRMRLSRSGLRLVLLVGVLGSAAFMAILYEPLRDPSRVYYGTDARMQALLLGAVVALVPALARPSTPVFTQMFGRIVRVPGSSVLALVSLGGLVAMFVSARELAPWMYQGGFLLAAMLSATLIAAISRAPRSLLGRALSWRPVVAVGVVSYGLYLWHWPVYIVVNHDRTGLDGAGLLLVRIVVTGALSFLSFRFVEEPIRRGRLQRRFTPTQWGRAVVATTSALALLILGATASVGPAGLPPPTEAADERTAPVPDAQGRLVQTFLLGDSQAYSLRTYYGNQVDGLGVNGSTQLGCGTLLPERHVDGQTMPNLPACAEWEARWTQEVAREKPDLVVLMLGLGELYDRNVDGSVVRFGTAEYRDWLYREIDHRRALVAGHTDRFVLATVLCIGISADAADRNAQLANDPDRLAWLNEAITSYTEVHPDVALIDLHGTICSDGYVEQIDGVQLRDDGLHLNAEGAALVWRQIGPQLIEAAR